MKKIKIALCCMGLALASCSDWLDVEPKTNVEETDLFKNEQGFKEVLTGIYVAMAGANLYGRELTYGFMDIIAQRYYNDANSMADYDRDTWYTYPSVRTEGYTNTFWNDGYNIIANINNLLQNIDRYGGNIKTPGYRDIIKGEALGLRSFIYLDLLRMFGPVYKDNAASPAIPYRTVFDRSEKKLMPANAVIDSIIGSLKEAELLLADDPMNISFSVNELDMAADPFLNHRFNRMNKYAVKAVMARAYMWKGDKANATVKAREVIDAGTGSGARLFTLVTDNSQDKVCSTELLFSLSMDSKVFADRIRNEFMVAMWNYYIISDVNRLYEIFDIARDGTNDMRMKEGSGFNISSNGAYTLKFSQENLYSYAIENQMPLVRLPEMYYILAECTPDLSEASRLLSVVRVARGVEGLLPFKSEDERMYNVEKEYRKEFYGEGQLWYFYKRNARQTFQFCPIASMKEANYRFPIPDDEVSLGNIY